jgi:acyl-coenzyme A thioesterase PaaI-like protein
MDTEPGCYGHGDDNPIGLGLTFEAGDGSISASFVPRAEHRGPPGHLHGGVAATALDETMAALGWVLDGVHCVTATLELRYRKPVPLAAGPLRIEAWPARDERGRRARRVHGQLLLADGTVAVEATGIFVVAGS